MTIVPERSRKVNAAPGICAVALCLALGPPALSAPGVPSVDELMAHLARAAGREPASYHETVVFTVGSLEGMRRTARRRADVHTVVDEGPFHTESGSVGGVTWRQNENGETVVDRPQSDRARVDAMTTTVERAPPPYAGYVLATLDAAGYGTKLFVDATTWRVVQRDVVTRGGTTTTF